MGIREVAVDVARGYQDIDASPENVDAYLNLIAPDETPELRKAMLSMSGCALVVRGLWRLLGVKHRRLDPPYKTGLAVADVVSIAKDRDAWTYATLAGRPGLGDVVLVGGNRDHDGGVEHVFTIVEISNSDKMMSIDGGQVFNKYQAIKMRNRAWEVRAGRLWDRAIDNYSRTRAVIGWADVTKIGASE